MALRHLPGGWRSALQFAQYAANEGDAAMGRVVRCWEGLKSTEQQTTTLEEICDMAGISPAEFVGRVAATAFALGRDVAELIAGANHGEVIARSVEEAKKAGGFRDREALMKHSRFLPVPQGSRINIPIGFQQNIETGPRDRAGLPSMEEENVRFTKLLRDEIDTPLIEAGKQDET